MNLYIFKSVADATQASARLSDTLTLKQSRAREVMGKGLGYNSYNALTAQIKQRPVLFEATDAQNEILNQYVKLTNTRDTLPQVETAKLFDDYRVDDSDFPEFGSYYAIEFETVAVVALAEREKYPNLFDALLDLGVITDAMHNEDLPMEFDPTPFIDPLNKDSSIKAALEVYNGYSLHTNTVLDVYGDINNYLATTGLHALYVTSTSTDSKIDEFDNSKLYQVVHDSGDDRNVNLVRVTDIRLCHLNSVSEIADSGKAFVIAPVSKETLGGAVGESDPLLVETDYFFEQITEERLDRLKPRNIDELQGAHHDPQTTLSLYLVDSEYCYPAYDDIYMSDRPHPFPTLVNIYKKGNTLYLEHADFLSLCMCMDDSAGAMQDSLGKVYHRLSRYAKERGIKLVSHFMTHQHLEEYPRLIQSEGFHLLPISVSFPEFPAKKLFEILGSGLKGVEAYDAKLQVVMESAKEIEERYQNIHSLITVLKELDVHSVSISELMDDDAGNLLSSTLAAHDKCGAQIGVFAVYSLFGYSNEYQALKSALNDSLDGGCHVVDVYEFEPDVDSQCLFWNGSIGQEINIVAPAKPYDDADASRHLIVTLETEDNFDDSSLLGKEIKGEVLKSCIPAMPSLEENTLGYSYILPLRGVLTITLIKDVLGGLPELRGHPKTKAEYELFYSKYVERVALVDKLIDEAAQVHPEVMVNAPRDKVGVVAFSEMSIANQVSVAINLAEHFHKVVSLPSGSIEVLDDSIPSGVITGASVEQCITPDDLRNYAGLNV
ncbi:hypothetical protein [Vibrio crassostreae]|uniref:hypothetical protein n=1 Tax=Vibrio crassostreae TaxID=246167 RepID=UPI001B30356D|nr:hypothetical protein [Vibrio crassostreae]